MNRKHSTRTLPEGDVCPLPALLSQTLVAFTVELDNEFERRTAEAGHPGAGLSLIVWQTVIQFLANGELTVRELSLRALLPPERLAHMLGCLERWTFLQLRPAAGSVHTMPLRHHPRARRNLRDGWGSGRGIRAEWIVSLTSKGCTAAETWPPLTDQIERRWTERFGRIQIDNLRNALQPIASRIDTETPSLLSADLRTAKTQTVSPSISSSAAPLSFPVLLSRILMYFATEFDHRARAPMALSANTLRILSKTPLREADIPHLTGTSPETSGIGWQIKPYVLVEPDPTARRGKTVRLTPLGLEAQREYQCLVSEIEKLCETRFGKDKIRHLKKSLQALFAQRNADGNLLMSKGLIPPPGVARSGTQVPALGRRDLGPAARKRVRDLVLQTEAFVRDPAAALPHFPLWDMNRGFGP
jgi:hypothetical protein